MSNFLINDAIKNVWCTPNQDMQSITQLAKLTPYGGVFNRVMVGWQTITLPKPRTKFHVYQVGALSPRVMGLLPSRNQWTNFIDACNNHQLIVTIYGNSGVQMPRTTTWYMITDDDVLVIAVQHQALIPLNLDEEHLFFRVYTNAFFNSIRSSSQNRAIKAQGAVVATPADILAMQHAYENYAQQTGSVTAFVNGYFVSGIDLFTAKSGDIVEFIYDSSVKAVHEVLISSLQSFVSEMDAKHKYLLHFFDPASHTIDFYDDVEIYLYKPEDTERHKGVYYHRNQPDAVRMVTHKDYSIPVPYVVGYASDQPTWTNPNDLMLRIEIRNSGYDRPLIFETNRIRELYKLEEFDLVRALIGIDSSVPEWTASHLEAAAYPAIMRSHITNVSTALVQNAYGYNAISRLMGITPQFTRNVNGARIVPVAEGLRTRSTAFEYDSNGHLLDWYIHLHGDVYSPFSPDTRLVEMFSGTASIYLDEVYQQRTQPVEKEYDYRFYLCEIINGLPTEEWVDVTDTGSYLIANNTITWNHDPELQYSMVRSNKYLLVNDIDLPVTDGVLQFTLTSDQYRNGAWATHIMTVPAGELRLFLNGRPLIENLDYVVQFPQVVISNKKYLVDAENNPQKLTVLYSGFCKPDLTQEIATDVGFVNHGILSNNNRFDIRDDKVMRIQVDGAIYHRSELQFSEDTGSIVVSNVSNGAPYLLQDIVVPIRSVITTDTYSMRAQSQITDKRISDYLTLKLPEPEITTPNVITERYPLYSPFCSAIINDLANGILDDERMSGNYSDNVVMLICAPYEHWLPFDPTQDGVRSDERYVTVHPTIKNTVTTLDLFAYRFLKRVVKLYLKDRVELSSFIELST